MKIKTGDKVKVISGKDKGKVGTVLRAIPKENRVVVQGVNIVKRAMRPTQKNPQGGFMEFEAPIYVSKVMLICPSCGKPTRVGYKFIEKNGKRKKVRVCKKCGAIIDK